MEFSCYQLMLSEWLHVGLVELVKRVQQVHSFSVNLEYRLL